MTAGDIYTVAGSAAGYGGQIGNGGPATSALLSSPEASRSTPPGTCTSPTPNNSQIQKVPSTTGTSPRSPATRRRALPVMAARRPPPDLAFPLASRWTRPAMCSSLTASTPRSGRSPPLGVRCGISDDRRRHLRGRRQPHRRAGTAGDGSAATSALLDDPMDMAVDKPGTSTSPTPPTTGSRKSPPPPAPSRPISMTAGDIYTIAGSASGASGSGGDGGPAVTAATEQPGAGRPGRIRGPVHRRQQNNRDPRDRRRQRHPVGPVHDRRRHLHRGRQRSGPAGTGRRRPGHRRAAERRDGIAVDPSGDLFITDSGRESRRSPPPPTPRSRPPPGRPTLACRRHARRHHRQPARRRPGHVLPPGRRQLRRPLPVAGGYCALPVQTAATLTYSTAPRRPTPSSRPRLRPTPTPRAGQLTAETDTAGDTLTITYRSPLPGSGTLPGHGQLLRNDHLRLRPRAGHRLQRRGLVTSVTDPMGRAWNYGYTATT